VYSACIVCKSVAAVYTSTVMVIKANYSCPPRLYTRDGLHQCAKLLHNPFKLNHCLKDCLDLAMENPRTSNHVSLPCPEAEADQNHQA